MRKLLILASGLLFAGAIFSTTATAEIRIGVAGPMTGQYAAFGRQMRRGVEMAIQEINAAGGIHGEKVMLAVGDDRCDAPRATTAAEQLAAKKVVLVVGHFCSGASIEASLVYAREKIIQISPASTNPVYTDSRPGPGVFRLAISDRKQADFAAAYIIKKFPGQKVAVLDDRTNFGASVAREVRQRLDATAQKPILNETYLADQKDFSALVAKMKAANIQVVYVGGYHPDIARIVREMRKQGVPAQMITTDALATTEFWQIARRTGEGTLFSFTADPRKNVAAAQIVKKFRSKKMEPDGYILASYTAVKLWADAAKAAGTTNFEKVVDGLMKVDVDSPIGRVRFDDKGDIREPQMTWYVWHAGKYAPLKSAP